jgi:hypothetical protein
MSHTDTERDAAKKLVLAAFVNQDRLNRVLADDWREKGWPYFRAIWREAAEGFDHINWEWWKNADPTAPITKAARQQIAIELADMLHFGLSSDIVQYGGNLTEIVDYYARCFELAEAKREDLEEQLELLIVDAIICKAFNVRKFSRACKAIGLPLSGLMAYYFGKTALNEFRWSNGYKEKTYKKLWKLEDFPKGVEDNVVLADVIDQRMQTFVDLESFQGAVQSGNFVAAVKSTMQDIYNQTA